VLLRRVIGDALRARRQAQHRTLREVSTAANVSLGYLSEIERGQKEASSELLAAICEALGAALSEVLRDVSDSLAIDEELRGLVPATVPAGPDDSSDGSAVGVPEQAPAAPEARLVGNREPRLTPEAKASIATAKITLSVRPMKRAMVSV